MTRVYWVVLLLVGLLSWPGCGGPTGPADGQEGDGDQQAEAVEPDDPAAVEALQAAASGLKRDGDGFVVEVDFRGAAVDDDTLAHLAGLQRLQKLTLTDIKPRQIESVESGDLIDRPMSDAGLAVLADKTTLRHLDLRGCPITNAALEHVAGLTDLQSLRLSGENGKTMVDDDGLAQLAGLTGLKVLALDFLFVSDEGIAQLDRLKNLKELYLKATSVGDELLAALPQYPQLKKLRVSQTGITDDGLAHLAKLPQLVELDLSECGQLSDGGMPHLSGLTNLVRLNLWRVNITDDGVAHLAGLINLEWLNLDNTLLSDAGLEHLAGMTQLEFLHLGSTGVTDAGMRSLEPLSSLKDLRVTRTGVTADGVAELKNKLPEVKIQLVYIPGQ
jgi:Leucine-rich repeat (LRR) protein